MNMEIEQLLSSKVLTINKHWMAVGETTVSEALADMCSGKATGLDMETLRPVRWDDWLALPIRAGDRQIRSLRGPVRVPTVVGKFSYEKMPKKRPKLDNRGIKERDGAICQYTGEYAPNGTVDHVVAISKGGERKSWKNMVWCQRDLNQKKSDKSLQETGLKLIRSPAEPKPLDVSLTIRAKHKDWLLFLPKQPAVQC